MARSSPSNPAEDQQHVGPAQPLHFPAFDREEERLGQSPRHLELCFVLYELLGRACAGEHSVRADQFVYWHPRSPRRCLAPDAFVKLGTPRPLHDVWKAWDDGVPELAVEILSESDSPERWPFKKKLRRYRELGVRELVCFDLDQPEGQRLRAWDLVGDDLVERIVDGERTPCASLGRGAAVECVVAPAYRFDRIQPAALRLERAGVLVPTDQEAADALAKEKNAERERADRAERELAQLKAKLGTRPD